MKEISQFIDLAVGGKITFKRVLNKKDWGGGGACRLYLSAPGQGPVTGSCERGLETSWFIKCAECLV